MLQIRAFSFRGPIAKHFAAHAWPYCPLVGRCSFLGSSHLTQSWPLFQTVLKASEIELGRETH